MFVILSFWSSDSDAQRGLAGGRRLLNAIAGMWAGLKKKKKKNDVISWTFLIQCNFTSLWAESTCETWWCNVLLLHLQRWQKNLNFLFSFSIWFSNLSIDFCSAYMGNAIVYLAWWNAFPFGGGNWEASFCKDSRILKEHNAYIFAQSHVFVSNNKQTLIPAAYIVRNLLCDF